MILQSQHPLHEVAKSCNRLSLLLEYLINTLNVKPPVDMNQHVPKSSQVRHVICQF